MYAFYAIMMLLGVMMLLFSFFMLIIERKKAVELNDKLLNNEENLVEVINDAELIVEEMNLFSDFLLERMDSKAKEIQQLLLDAEQKMAHTQQGIAASLESHPANQGLHTQVLHLEESVQHAMKKAANGEAYPNTVTVPAKDDLGEQAYETPEVDLVADELKHLNVSVLASEKIIPLNPKHRNVYALYEKGYGEVEIAKILKMGAGEVRLILGVKR